MDVLVKMLPDRIKKLIPERLKSLFRRHGFPQLTYDLAKKDILFKSPPFTTDIVEAIKFISPQYSLRPDNSSRRFWEKEQSACCWGEYKVICDYILKKPKPKKCLEIGPGMGRSVVFFTKKFDLEEAEFHLYESTGCEPKYTVNGPRFNDSFCGNIGLLRKILEYNGIRNYKIFDAKNLNFNLNNLPGPYDLIYSFYAVGYHWNLENFIDEILDLMHETTLALFIVHDNFEPFEKLKKVHFKVIDYEVGCLPGRIDKMLVISKSPA